MHTPKSAPGMPIIQPQKWAPNNGPQMSPCPMGSQEGPKKTLKWTPGEDPKWASEMAPKWASEKAPNLALFISTKPHSSIKHIRWTF